MVTCPTVENANSLWRNLRSVEALEPVFAPAKSTGIHPTAVIGKNVEIGAGTEIMASVVIEDDVTIGANVVVHPGCYLGVRVTVGDGTIIRPSVVVSDGTEIGKRVFIDSGAIIGSDGFGFASDKTTGKIEKVPQVGTVRIEDRARIGAGATLDRATLGKTVIGRNVQVGALSQVAHNVQLGEDTTLGPQVGICGSTCIGNGAEVGAQAGIVGHLKIGDGARLGTASGITKNVSEGADITGSPALDREDYERRLAAETRLPELFQRVKAIEQKLAL